MIGGFRSWLRRVKSAVSAERVRGSCGVQKIFRALRPRQRPVILFSPLIGAHHEDFYRLAGKFVLSTLKQILVPLQSKLVFVVFSRSGAKVDIANFSAAARVPSDGNEKMLSTTRCFTFMPR